MRLASSLAFLAAAKASIEYETIVTEQYYSDKGCNELIFGVDFSHHSNECVQMGGDGEPIRYEKSVCKQDGTIEERLYTEKDTKCEGEPYKKFTIQHGGCMKQIQFGSAVYVRQKLDGHCMGARTCDNGWKCEDKWQLNEYDEGEHPTCHPFADSKEKCDDFQGLWARGECNPPKRENVQASCPGSWAESHEGSRLARCMYPKATCPGCGYYVSKAKVRCKNGCLKSSKRIPGTKAACSCSAMCKDAMAWMLKPAKKSGKKARCYCYAADGPNASMKISGIIEEDNLEAKGFWLSTNKNGVIES